MLTKELINEILDDIGLESIADEDSNKEALICFES